MPRLTDELLRKLQEGGEIDRHLVDVYWEELRAIAKRRLAPAIQRRVGPSDVVSIVLKKALSDLKGGRQQVANSEEYRRLLLAYLKKKILEIARRETASKRDALSEVPALEGSFDMVSQELDPIVAAAANELYDYLVAGESERDAAIISAAIPLGMTPTEIASRWDELIPNTKPLSVKMISLIVKRAQEKARKYWKSDP